MESPLLPSSRLNGNGPSTGLSVAPAPVNTRLSSQDYTSLLVSECAQAHQKPDGGADGVLPHHHTIERGSAEGHGVAREEAVAIDALASHAVQRSEERRVGEEGRPRW